MRPVSGVVHLAAECLQPLEPGRDRRRQGTGGHQTEPRGDHLAATGGHGPVQRPLIEDRGGHRRVEGDVPAQVQLVGDPVEVAQDLGLRGVLLGPVPFLLQFIGERVAIVDALDIAASTGVTVEVPGATDVRGGLEDAHRQSLRTKLVQRIQPGESGADDHGIKGHGQHGRPRPPVAADSFPVTGRRRRRSAHRECLRRPLHLR